MSDGEGVTTYAYNAYRQLQSETRTFTGLVGRTHTLSYTYNQADQLKSVNYSVTGSGSLMPERGGPARNAALPTGGQRSRALVDYTISGTVRAAGTNAPISGATVTATRTDDPPLSPAPVQTNAQGQYTIEGAGEGLTYQVTAVKSGYTFAPNPANVSMDGNKVVDFTGTSTAPPSGTLSAGPNPTQVCDGSGLGVTTLTWTAAGSATSVQIRKGSPSGPLVASGGISGSVNTGQTVANGTVFYLQNVTGGLPLTAANTLATRTVNTTTAGCPTFSAFNKNVNYAYNSVGALSGVGTNLIGTNAGATTNVLSSLSYRGSGAISTVNYGNGRKLEMGYSANRQQPVSMKVSMASNANDKIMDYAYEYYDANGKNNNRIRKITDNLDAGYTTTYAYDDYDRLSTATATAYTRFYYYDEWGNIKNFNGLALNHATNASGAPATNRLSTDGFGFAYTYDSAGNQTNAPGYTYTYDGANRLKTVNGSGASYGYDGDGRKVRQTTGSNAIFYVYSSLTGTVAMEVNSSHGVYRHISMWARNSSRSRATTASFTGCTRITWAAAAR
jgi:hypothetical protein